MPERRAGKQSATRATKQRATKSAAKRATKRARSGRSNRPGARKWSARVTQRSNALDLDPKQELRKQFGRE